MDDRIIQQILNSTNIVDIISLYIPLKRTGNSYKARCPFHDEKTPSFNVSESKQLFKCFGCGKGGNAITFIRDYEKISFFEALKKLGDRVGIQVENESYTKRVDSKRELIYNIYTLANDFFMQNLKRQGTTARAYLQKRNITPEVAEQFSLGYALNSFKALKNHLEQNQINSHIFSETGLFRENDKKEIYDLFRERLMFPIHSTAGQVVAFGGRSLDPEDNKAYKYINSPTTEIYQKGMELYGLHLTRFDIMKIGSAYICEGYFDFLRLYCSGIRNCVASLGTALTTEQVNLLGRYTKNLFLLYDGDDAGIKAAVRASALAIQHGATPHIILLPEKQDPDDYLQKHSLDDFQQLPPLTLVKFAQNHQHIFAGERQTIQMLLDYSVDIIDDIAKDLFIKEISDTFKVSEINLRKGINTQRAFSHSYIHQNQQVKKHEEEKNLLTLLLRDPTQIPIVAKTLDASNFLYPQYLLIYTFLLSIDNPDDITQPAFLIEKYKTFCDSRIPLDIDTFDASLIDALHTSSETLSLIIFDDEVIDEIDDLITQVHLRKLENDLRLINQKYAQNPDQTELLEEKDYIKKEILKISKNIVRKTIPT